MDPQLRANRPDGAEVLIVGAGVVGLGIAWRAATMGIGVVVVDPSPLKGASRAAAGMLAPVTELEHGEEALLRLNLASAAMYPQFVAELEDLTGLTVGYRACGTLSVAADVGDRAALLELHSFQQSLGLASCMLSSRECRRVEPGLAPGVRAGLLVDGDHQVDNRRLLAALAAATRLAGAVTVQSRVARVLVGGAKASGVALEDGSVLRGDTVVLAAGAHCANIAGIPPGALPPVRPVKGQILRLRGPASARVLERTVRGTVAGSRVYLVPRADGEVVVGATMEEMGFDERVTAGAVYSLLRDATALVPGLSELELDEATAGLRPGSPDNAPILGPTPVDGLVAATGHHRNGILLAPVSATAIAALLVGDGLPEEVRPFSPERFAGKGVALQGAPDEEAAGR